MIGQQVITTVFTALYTRSRKLAHLLSLSLYLYIYPSDSQESAEGAIHRASSYPELFPEMPRYCCPLEILIKI